MSPALLCPNLTGINPHTGEVVRLFHPRRDRWFYHFAYEEQYVVGTTLVGRTTVSLLEMNDPELRRIREHIAQIQTQSYAGLTQQRIVQSDSAESSVIIIASKGVNEIPAAMAKLLSEWLGFPVETSIVQANTVGHTGASGFQRLANQACFVGEVERGEQYLIVDDFVGQGGTLANLIGYVESQGGHAAGATVLTGKPYSAMLAPDDLHIRALRDKHGQEFEDWWRESFGFGFDCLTRSEARYLENSPDAQTIRDRLAAAGLESRSGPTAR